jgi:hypothetical protein
MTPAAGWRQPAASKNSSSVIATEYVSSPEALAGVHKRIPRSPKMFFSMTGNTVDFRASKTRGPRLGKEKHH